MRNMLAVCSVYTEFFFSLLGDRVVRGVLGVLLSVAVYYLTPSVWLKPGG